MTRRLPRLAAVALATAALAPWAAADPAGDVEARVRAAEQRITEVEQAGATAAESPSGRAARNFTRGVEQHCAGDWLHAAYLLADAVDEPAFRSSPDRPEALFLLADALRRNGACGAARARYAEYLGSGTGARRGEAFAGALRCAVDEHRARDVEDLVRDAEREFAGEPPAEVRYLTAKGLFERKDLPQQERWRRATAAFDHVGQPYQLQAWYFQGVLQIEQQNLHGSLQWFDSCARAEPEDQKQSVVRELCVLALGRVHSQMGNYKGALDWYAAIPADSPRFVEAISEVAWVHVHANEFDEALRMATFIADFAPSSPFAPEATLLEGHLLLRLGRYSGATDAYNRVINSYSPVRDEIDAILSLREDPVRYFNELIGRQGDAFDASTVLPPVAVKWAADSHDLSVALELVSALDSARREARESADVAARIDAVLSRGGGLDAFPELVRTYANAHAVENDAARTEGDLVTLLSAAAQKALAPGRAAELAQARAARAALQPKIATLPRTPQEVEDRLYRMRSRVGEVERAAYRLSFAVRESADSIDATETWLGQHRAEISGEPEARDAVTSELRKHRAFIEGYEADIRALRRDIDLSHDIAGGADAMADESAVRASFLEAVELERLVAETARGSLAPAERSLFERADAIRERLATLRTRARSLKIGIAAEASARAATLRARVGAEKVELAGHGGALDGIQSVAKDVVGKVTYRAIENVRGRVYRLVLKADVGVVDVAWSRKRARLEKIQQLSMQKATEVEQLDREYRALLREVD